MTVFETERLRAREWAPDDAEAAYAIYRDPAVTRYLGGGQPVESIEEQRARLQRWITANETYRDRGLGVWALEEKDTGALVGMSLLKPLPGHEEVEVGWHLGPAFWGKGYATESGRAAIERGFTTCGLDVVYAVVVRENAASLAVARRLGMAYRGSTDAYYDRALELFEIRP